MRNAAICLLACCGLIAFSSCASKTDGLQKQALDEEQNDDAEETAAAKAARQDLLRPTKTEVVRLAAFPGGLSLEKHLQPEDQNQKVEICDPRSGGITDSQRHALKEFVANEKHIFRSVREAIYRNYRENLPHRDQLRSVLRKTAIINGHSPEEWEKKGMDELPEIKRGNELDQKVALVAIIVRCPVNGVSKIGLLYQCSWDPDNDLGVRIAGSAVEEVGNGEVADSD
jgi:hypothetical protein